MSTAAAPVPAYDSTSNDRTTTYDLPYAVPAYEGQPGAETPSRGGLRALPPAREVHATSTEWDWQLHAACRGGDTDVFFHPWGERDPSRSRRDARAKAVCAGCPVARECGAYALATREPYGVWGGMTADEREEILGVRFG